MSPVVLPQRPRSSGQGACLSRPPRTHAAMVTQEPGSAASSWKVAFDNLSIRQEMTSHLDWPAPCREETINNASQQESPLGTCPVSPVCPRGVVPSVESIIVGSHRRQGRDGKSPTTCELMLYCRFRTHDLISRCGPPVRLEAPGRRPPCLLYLQQCVTSSMCPPKDL